MSEDERFAKRWLEECGYRLEFQPRHYVPTGRCPDFLATATADATPSLFWAEVKSLEPEATRVALANTWPVLKSISPPPGLNGQAWF